MRASEFALRCAVAVILVARAPSPRAYTVDCNHEYTDCDNELSKTTIEDDEPPLSGTLTPMVELSTSVETTTSAPTIITPKIVATQATENQTEYTTESIKPEPRLLNLNDVDLQSFANALHNQTEPKGKTDLSDINLEADDDDSPRMMEKGTIKSLDHSISDKFYTNLQAPFHPLINADKSDEAEGASCKENEITYKIGDRLDRGCDETCECSSGGVFDCSPRCKHPYIRQGRRLADPLCFESPVDECCSIVACATGNTDGKIPSRKNECHYGNDTYALGSSWSIGCEQVCSCAKDSVVTCKPRCAPLPASDKCIKLQDPNDACCEVQVCDVSQDVHEEPENITSSTTSTTTTEKIEKILLPKSSSEEELVQPLPKSTNRPLVLAEPIGSVKVLQNNTVQVNLIHLNNSEDPIHLLLSSDGGISFKDVELKYSNLILNLDGGKDYVLKTKETGTKFNFTMTTIDSGLNDLSDENVPKDGCMQDGKFYKIGEEFHIGCSELCECTGPGTKECAALECPSHVGLELVSRGCVRWAPSPPPQPPNCCPRAARCLSDGTCHYKGIAVPNWSEVPIAITGCEERCFCENGELDCQEVCSPLPPVPPQSFRCPPMHRPAAVNISDEDCCKQWGCVPNAADESFTLQNSMPIQGRTLYMGFITPTPPVHSTITPVLSTPPIVTRPFFYKHFTPLKTLSISKYVKAALPLPIFPEIKDFRVGNSRHAIKADNITVFTLDDSDSPFKVLHPEPPLTTFDTWEEYNGPMTHKPFISFPVKTDHYHINSNNKISVPSVNYVQQIPHVDDLVNTPNTNKTIQMMQFHDSERKMKIEKKPKTFDQRPLFQPALGNILPDRTLHKLIAPKTSTNPNKTPLFKPLKFNRFPDHQTIPLEHTVPKSKSLSTHNSAGSLGRHVTILKSIDYSKARPRTVEHKEGIERHILTKNPNPYESVLLRDSTSNSDSLTTYTHNTKDHKSGITSTIDLDNILSQMEMESEVNRNLGRSADNLQDKTLTAGAITPQEMHTSKPLHPAFLPTIPPDTTDYPQEEDEDVPGHFLPPRITRLPGIPGLPTRPPEEIQKLSVISLQADSPTSMKLLFGLPPVLVGLRGSVDLRYTDKDDDDVSHWYSQVFAPVEEVLSTARLEFRLTGLKPSTKYRVRGKLFLHNLHVEPESDVYTVQTLDLPSVPVEEKRREVDSSLAVVDVNDTIARVTWRHYTDDELQFIDGIQIRFRPVGTPIYVMTELLHHSRSTAELHDLRPGTKYEASLVLVPPPRSAIELHDPAVVDFTTKPKIDPYGWSVILEARAVGSEAAELTWRGVPSPAERWVRVYRAAHACGNMRAREHDAFRLAARDQPPAITVTGLEPDTRCRVWLELFLTNGKAKTSNVLEINTKSLDTPEIVDNIVEASSVSGGRGGANRGDYYGALVVVGVVAALGAVTSLLLLLIVVRRHRPRSVPITPLPSAPRESSLPPYDNPAYKIELQQETMDL